VLVVRAEYSEVFAAADLGAVVSLFPSARAAELPDSGHMIMWENPHGVADLAIRFLHSSP
jgi:pimeloyl-ACP methyl ester carboxylesterase